MKVLVTGAAGFIGFHLVRSLLNEGHQVVGLDNINDYYSVDLKYARLKECGVPREDIKDGLKIKSKLFLNYWFIKASIEDNNSIDSLFKDEKFDLVVNLAAQAGVRYSLENPRAYVNSNVLGFVNILEACRSYPVKHLVYASSSSVYGSNTALPFNVNQPVDHPVSLYAATKRSNELMAHTYSHLFGVPTTGLRFFTVYGPWGRPDMAPMLFANAIISGKPLSIFNNGEMKRDFTFIDDIISGIVRVMFNPSTPSAIWNSNHPELSSSDAPFKIYNIGNSSPVSLMNFIELLEEKIGRSANKKYLSMQPGDVVATWADIKGLIHDVGYNPSKKIEDGIGEFVNWYLKYYNVKTTCN